MTTKLSERIALLEALLEKAVETLEARKQHESSSFIGIEGLGNERISLRGVQRKEKQSLQAIKEAM